MGDECCFRNWKRTNEGSWLVIDCYWYSRYIFGECDTATTCSSSAIYWRIPCAKTRWIRRLHCSNVATDAPRTQKAPKTDTQSSGHRMKVSSVFSFWTIYSLHAYVRIYVFVSPNFPNSYVNIKHTVLVIFQNTSHDFGILYTIHI